MGSLVCNRAPLNKLRLQSMAAWPNPLDEPLDVLDQPFDLGPPGFASLLQLDACLLETSLAKEPAAAANKPSRGGRCRRPTHLRLAQLRLSPLESILITDINADLDIDRFGDGVLPKRRRSSTTASYDLSRDTSSDASFGVGGSDPSHKTAPSGSQWGDIEESPRSCKRQVTESAVDRYMYVCNYCGRHKLSASKGQDGRVRIRCECGGKYKDGVPRMHAQWSAAPPSDDQSS